MREAQPQNDAYALLTTSERVAIAALIAGGTRISPEKAAQALLAAVDSEVQLPPEGGTHLWRSID